MKNTIATCCSVLSHCKLALPIQVPSYSFGGTTLSQQTTCWFGYSTSMLLCFYEGPTCSDLLFGKNGWSCCDWALVGSSGLDGLPGLGGAPGDLALGSPIHHGLYAGDAASSSYAFQKRLLPQRFIRAFFVFNFPCKTMLAGPIAGDVFFTTEEIKSTWRHFEEPFCHCQLWEQWWLRSCFAHQSHKMPALLAANFSPLEPGGDHIRLVVLH